MHIKLPLLARGGMEALQEVADQWQLQVLCSLFERLASLIIGSNTSYHKVRGSAGEHSEAEGGKYDISNR